MPRVRGESLTRVRMCEAGLPAPELQIVVRDANGTFVARCDLGLLPDGLLIEFDGRVKYTTLRTADDSAVDVILREKYREERLRELGFQVLRVSWSDLDGARWLGRLERLRTIGRQAVQRQQIAGTARPLAPLTIGPMGSP